MCKVESVLEAQMQKDMMLKIGALTVNSGACRSFRAGTIMLTGIEPQS